MSLIVTFLSTKINPGVDATTSLGDSSHKYTDLWLSATIQFPSGGSIVIDTTTGLKIGTGTTQKIGFYNSTAIVQPGATTDLGTVLSNLGLRAVGTAYPITTSGAVTLTGGLTVNTTGITLTDKDIVLGTSTGSKIGTATSQKLSVWSATPIVQPTTGVGAATLVGGGGTALTDTDTFDGYTLKQVVKALRNIGLLA